MKNRQLEREKDTISYIIDGLVSEIEELESVNDSLRDELDFANDEIKQLKYKLSKLEL
jgi:peptidoglycan hydrolase CwlO-like protein